MKGPRAWTSTLVEAEKASLRAWLDAQSSEPKARMQCLLREIRAGKEGGEGIRQFLLIVFALAHHLRHPSLPPAEIRSLGYMGDALLRIHGIEPGKSKVSFLFGDLHLILSQIYWREGNPWEAAWEQLLSANQGGAAPEWGEGTSLLALASRALRLGQVGSAQVWLREALGRSLPMPLQLQAQLKLLISFRFTGELSEAEALEKEILRGSPPSSEVAKEVVWERWCREMGDGDGLDPMMSAVRRGGTHHEVTYLLEAFLWSRTVATKKWITRYPNFRKLAYSSQIAPDKKDPLLVVTQAITGCYDAKITLGRRLRDLGDALAQGPRLLNVGQELLAWGAARRWLLRTQIPYALELVVGEYEGLSLRLSHGARPDALGAFAEPPSAKAAAGS